MKELEETLTPTTDHIFDILDIYEIWHFILLSQWHTHTRTTHKHTHRSFKLLIERQTITGSSFFCMNRLCVCVGLCWFGLSFVRKRLSFSGCRTPIPQIKYWTDKRNEHKINTGEKKRSAQFIGEWEVEIYWGERRGNARDREGKIDREREKEWKKEWKKEEEKSVELVIWRRIENNEVSWFLFTIESSMALFFVTPQSKLCVCVTQIDEIEWAREQNYGERWIVFIDRPNKPLYLL